MNRTKADKLESNISSLQNEIDRYHLGTRKYPEIEETTKDLSARIFELIHGFDVTTAPDLLAACEAAYLDAVRSLADGEGCPFCKSDTGHYVDGEYWHREQCPYGMLVTAIAATRPATEPVAEEER